MASSPRQHSRGKTPHKTNVRDGTPVSSCGGDGRRVFSGAWSRKSLRTVAFGLKLCHQVQEVSEGAWRPGKRGQNGRGKTPKGEEENRSTKRGQKAKKQRLKGGKRSRRRGSGVRK